MPVSPPHLAGGGTYTVADLVNIAYRDSDDLYQEMARHLAPVQAAILADLA
jgi:hypothetical protein